MNKNDSSIRNVRKKFHELHDLISTSYHESGHVIYGLLHRMPIDSVSVVKNKKSKRIEGDTHYYATDFNKIKDPKLLNIRIHDEIGLSYSGLIAEKYFFKMISGSDKFPMFLRDGSSHDISEASKLFKTYNLSDPGKKRYNYKQKFIRGVNKELENNWEAVTLIAHALVKRKKIPREEIKFILTTKTKNKDFWKKQFKAIDYMFNNINLVDGIDDKNLQIILSM